MKRANVMVIGVGPHARRIYIPILDRLSKKMAVSLKGVVDLKEQQNLIDQYLEKGGYSPERLYIDPFDPSLELPVSCTKVLDDFVDKMDIQGVIISTEPLVHKVYAKWALSRGLHILMDKPISVRKALSTDEIQGKAILDDYEELLSLYRKVQSTRSTVFSVNVQRRYEYGFEKVKELVSEVRDRFNTPVTSIQAMHADGTWMFPLEVLTQRSHSHFDGYGKIAHSGYHIFDMVWQIYTAGSVDDKHPDSFEIISSPLLPAGLNVCISEKDYRSYFGDEYQPTGLTKAEYIQKVQGYGEVDSFNIVRLLKDGENICNVSIDLLHSSFSRRAWATPNVDRYKGNGRVKHQQFVIQQGPFQCIQIHNYQSNAFHDIDNSEEFNIGGNNHFDIYVFRNKDMFGSGKALTKFSAKELEKEKNSSGLVNENAKVRVVSEFVNFMLGNLNKSELKSNIDSHTVPVKIMSGICQSSARLLDGSNPLVKLFL